MSIPGWRTAAPQRAQISDSALEVVAEQFAQEYQGQNGDKDFKKKLLRALNAALAV
jgi:flagellar basal body-associated protein FliL